MKAILLSAGKGTRMMPLTKNTPKCLLHVGNGLTVLETQLETLKQTPVSDIVIVTGYLSEQVEAKVKKYTELNITIVYNPFFDVSNNFVSLWMAREHISSDFMIINGDDIFKKEVITYLLDSSSDACMVIDKKKEYVADDMRVTLDGDLVVQVSKHLPDDKTHGESVGIMKFMGSAVAKIKSTLDVMIREPGSKDIFYLEAINRFVAAGNAMRFVEVAEDSWAEIDFHPDYDYIQDKIEKFHTFS